MTLGERVRYVRKDLNMTQNSFGDSLGISRDAVNNLEGDRLKKLNDSILRLICKTHRVDYFWLTEEIGEPYTQLPEIIIEDAIEEYGLDQTDKKIIEEYVKLDPKTRDAFKNYIKNVFKNAPD